MLVLDSNRTGHLQAILDKFARNSLLDTRSRIARMLASAEVNLLNHDDIGHVDDKVVANSHIAGLEGLLLGLRGIGASLCAALGRHVVKLRITGSIILDNSNTDTEEPGRNADPRVHPREYLGDAGLSLLNRLEGDEGVVKWALQLLVQGDKGHVACGRATKGLCGRVDEESEPGIESGPFFLDLYGYSRSDVQGASGVFLDRG